MCEIWLLSSGMWCISGAVTNYTNKEFSHTSWGRSHYGAPKCWWLAITLQCATSQKLAQIIASYKIKINAFFSSNVSKLCIWLTRHVILYYIIPQNTSHCWEANSCSAIKTPILGVRFHNSPTLVPMLSQIRLMTAFSKWSLYFRLSHQNP